MNNSIKVFQNIGDNVICFDTKEDFMKHYNKNKETIDGMSTRGLNVKYKIEGFKIGRSKGEIILYPLKESKSKSDSETDLNIQQQSQTTTSKLAQPEIKNKLTIEEKLDFINRRIKKIEEMLTLIINQTIVTE